jgi:hypothetical protein
VSIDVTDPQTGKRMAVNETERFVVARCGRLRKIQQRIDNNLPLAQRAERDFTDDVRMRQHFAPLEELAEDYIARTKMIDPDRRIDQDHLADGRRRGTSLSRGSLPPSRASRRALSRSINAINASRMSAVLSRKPVRDSAFARSPSSKANVVRIARLAFKLGI